MTSKDPGPQCSGLLADTVDSDIHELAEVSVFSEDTERTVAGVDQIDCSLDDLPQRGIQIQAGRHRQHGLQQRVHPIAGAADDCLNAILHLAQQLAQPTFGQGFAHRS